MSEEHAPTMTAGQADAHLFGVDAPISVPCFRNSTRRPLLSYRHAKHDVRLPAEEIELTRIPMGREATVVPDAVPVVRRTSPLVLPAVRLRTGEEVGYRSGASVLAPVPATAPYTRSIHPRAAVSTHVES